MSASQHLETEVLIVGAGPVGLATAIELGHRGVRCMIVERHDRVGRAPRAKTTNVRSREHLRRWGIADDLRKASRLPADYPSDIVFATRMNGPLLARIENGFHCAPDRNDLYSESGQWIPQYVLEEVLRAHASTLPSVSIRFNCELVEIAQNGAEVTSQIEDAGHGRLSVRSKYVVGADGARSTVRGVIGAQMIGRHAISRNYNVQFRAPDLAARHHHPRAIHYWLVNSDAPSLIGPMDGLDRWYFIATKIDVDPEAIDPNALIRRSTGLDFDMEIVGVDPWVAHSLIADRYAHGRVFLAGDAAHLHPPFGGYGMNMGIGDGVDLGWKLAATLQGWGGPALLASYEIERRRVHERVIEEAVTNYARLGNQLVKPGIEAVGPVGDATRREVGDIILATKVREFRNLGLVLGYRYESPVIVDDGSAPPPEDLMHYAPSSYPGCLAPHLWLEDGSSLYDWFGPGFTLLDIDPEAGATTAVSEAAAARGIPFTVVTPQPDCRLRPRYEKRLALIRPDQHVAWRGDEVPEDPAALLDRVCGRVPPGRQSPANSAKS